MHQLAPRAFSALLTIVALTATAGAQNPPATQPARRTVEMDTARARQLYVSKDPKDLPSCGANCAAQMANKKRTDSAYAARAKGVMEFHKVSFKSRADGMTIPAYLFAPLTKKPEKHSALVWIHGGVHGDWGIGMWPFVKEAVQKGYVIITPEYRGSTGFGEAHYLAIDYGGKEVDDALSSVDYLKTLPYVDMDRLGAMGWSHGGFIVNHILFRYEHPFKAGAAMVPVTNLFFRLSDHSPGYARSFATQPGIQGLPFENPEEYIKRSPVYHVANLKVPLLVHVATNDCDVFYRENVQMVHTLRSLKPDLAETKIYDNPPWVGQPERVNGCGHTFNRRVTPMGMERDDSPEQIDSWNRTWTFFEWNLRPASVRRPAGTP
jgi:dipeptidyl aminopeptidase/acylaminoacyl peptidase